MTLISCRTLYNKTKLVPAETMIQRPSVYGMVIHERKLLVAQARFTKKYVLPGGGIHRGEAIQDALKREVWEETGIAVEVGAFLHFHEDFFYYDPLELAIHGFLFYYRCTPLSIELNPPEYPDDEGLDLPLWVEIDTLTPGSFQTHGTLALELLNSLSHQ